MNITIIGAGNIGTQLAVLCKNKKHHVTLYTKHPNETNHKLILINSDKNEKITQSVDCITDLSSIAFTKVDLIFITYPLHLMKLISEELLPFIKPGIKIVLVPGSGGAELYFKEHVLRGAIIIGLERVISIARFIKKGEIVNTSGYKPTLTIATIPKKYGDECAGIFYGLFEIPCNVAKSYLYITMTTSNSILHTTRCYNLFKDKLKYENIPLFYEEWNNETSDLLIKCDKEVMLICQKLQLFDMKSLSEYYESKTPSQLTNKITSISAFKGILSPMISDGKYFVPDFDSRYFKADFSCGLAFLIRLGELLEVETPNMSIVLNWYLELVSDKIKIPDFDEKFLDLYKE